MGNMVCAALSILLHNFYDFDFFSTFTESDIKMVKVEPKKVYKNIDEVIISADDICFETTLDNC